MKKIIILIVLIIAIVAGFFIVKNIQAKNYDYEIKKIAELNFFIYKENEKYGVIDKTGKVVVKANYEEIIIPNPEKDIFVCTNNNKNTILNSNNEELFTDYDEVEPIKLKNVANALSYEKDTLRYKKEGLYGVIDLEGKQITNNNYTSIENLQPTEGKFLVEKDGKKGVIDLAGNSLVPVKYDVITSDGYYTKTDEYKKSGFIVANKSEDGYKYGYINFKGKELIGCKFNEIDRISKEDEDIFLIVSNNGKKGTYKNSKNIIDHEFENIEYDENTELLIVQKNRKYGAKALNGKSIINVEYEEIEPKGIYLYAKNQSKNNVYDSNGNIVDINFNKSIYKTENEKYMISILLNNNISYYGIVDQNGNELVKEEYRYIEYLYGDYFIASNDEGNFGIINNNGRTILNFNYLSMQKIKGKSILQALNKDTELTEIYSQEMKNVLKMKNPSIQIQEEYVIISSEEDKKYLDNKGQIIEDTSNLKNTDFPDKIGEYKKEQTSLEIAYYVKQ